MGDRIFITPGNENAIAIAPLSQIIQDINQQFGTNFTENERVFLEQMETTLDRTLQTTISINDRTNIKLEFDDQAKELRICTILAKLIYNWLVEHRKISGFSELTILVKLRDSRTIC